MEILEGNQVVEISKLKEEVKKLEGELRSRDQGMETLMVEKVDLVDHVMNWEAEAIAARDSLMEVKLTRGVDITNAVDKTLAKFKSSNEFATLLKKDHKTRFDTRVEAIFYNICTHYRDLDYAFLRGELIDLIGEWLEEERLNGPDVALPSAPFSPST